MSICSWGSKICQRHTVNNVFMECVNGFLVWSGVCGMKVYNRPMLICMIKQYFVIQLPVKKESSHAIKPA